MSRKLTIGVDIGGSHLTSAIVDNSTKDIIHDSIIRSHYDHTLDMKSLLNIWAETIKSSMDTLGIATQYDGIGIAIPGPFEYSNGISRIEHKLIALYGKHLPTELNQSLGLQKPIPIRFNNDATSFAIGEAFRGAGQTKQRVVAITLGTGFGAAFIEDKLPIVDRLDVPPKGSLWQLPFKASIADEYFSTNWFVDEYSKLSADKISGVKELLSKDAEIVKQIFLEFANNLGLFLAPHLKNFNAEILIIGGNISKALNHFITPLTTCLRQHDVQTNISSSALLEKATLIGSAQLFDDHYWEKVSKVLPAL